MFDTILIANRGEIAARVIRTANKMGIRTVAVYSEADAGAPHVEAADEAVEIGPARVTDSYLKIEAVIDAAKEHDAEAIHPGYGLLSENPEFVRAVEDAGITFIGPRPEVMELMGNKSAAREFANNADCPTVPGSDGAVESVDEAHEIAEQLGYPVLVKASAGGGGIGMNLATNADKLEKAIETSKRRAESAFGDPTFYIEKYIENPRHVEVQVMADNDGHAVHFFERECSVQRRHQKVIEEAPSPASAQFENLREQMGQAALNLVEAADYTNAGTVEFILSPNGDFYFIEMNTRLQVEHPCTEMITGHDLVEWQIRIAAGEALQVQQDELSIDGHSIECRIYAENPDKRFMPAPGNIGEYSEPSGEGIRVDSGVTAGYKVTPHYDPMVAKVITHGADRDAAIERMKTALKNYHIGELTTNIPMHLEVLDHEDFRAGDVHTSWLEDEYL